MAKFHASFLMITAIRAIIKAQRKRKRELVFPSTAEAVKAVDIRTGIMVPSAN